MGSDPDTGRQFYGRDTGSTSLSNESLYDTVGKKNKDRKVHSTLDPKNSNRDCVTGSNGQVLTPVVVVSDFTISRGKDIEIVDQKLPMLIGQLIMKNYVTNPMISFAGLGDAKYDQAPIQVGHFYNDDKLDSVLSQMWPEKGGGGNGRESYELMAYYYAYHSIIDCNRHGKKGILFIIGDERFYDTVSKDEVKQIIGDDLPEDLKTKNVFQDLQEKYEVFFLFPKKSWEERRKNIDLEIKKRVEEAGGLHDGVDIRVSLLWNNRNDLDLHVITPSNFEIYYPSSNKVSPCGGFLDVDMNVRGETTKPVENIQWKKGSAKKGQYRVFVQNFRFHEESHGSTKFKVEVEINGKIQSFEKAMPSGLTGSESNVPILTFEYNPEERPVKGDVYEQYDDKLIIEQWSSVIPDDHVIVFENPKAIVDIILGVLAINDGNMDIEDYVLDMKNRGQETSRLEEVREALDALASESMPTVNLGDSDGLENKETKGNTRRL